MFNGEYMMLNLLKKAGYYNQYKLVRQEHCALLLSDL